MARRLETGDLGSKETDIHLASISLLRACQRRCRECAERLRELQATASLFHSAGPEPLPSHPGGRAASTHLVPSSRHSRECVCTAAVVWCRCLYGWWCWWWWYGVVLSSRRYFLGCSWNVKTKTTLIHTISSAEMNVFSWRLFGFCMCACCCLETIRVTSAATSALAFAEQAGREPLRWWWCCLLPHIISLRGIHTVPHSHKCINSIDQNRYQVPYVFFVVSFFPACAMKIVLEHKQRKNSLTLRRKLISLPLPPAGSTGRASAFARSIGWQEWWTWGTGAARERAAPRCALLIQQYNMQANSELWYVLKKHTSPYIPVCSYQYCRIADRRRNEKPHKKACRSVGQEECSYDMNSQTVLASTTLWYYLYENKWFCLSKPFINRYTRRTKPRSRSFSFFRPFNMLLWDAV